MSDSWYRDGALYVLARNGMPEHNVEIGVGDTYREALSNLEATALQSTGRDGGIAAALAWAHSAGWISDPDELECADDPGGKETVGTWETVDSYVQTYPADDALGLGACDVEVQVGQGEDGQWYMRSYDDAGGSDDADDTAYSTREDVETAAEAFAAEHHEGEDGEDAEEYLDRIGTERTGEPDPEGEWACYWTTVLDGESHVEDRYATREQAELATEAANKAFRAANPGPTLCGYEVRELVDREWRPIDEE